MLFIIFAAVFMFTVLVYFMPQGPAQQYDKLRPSLKVLQDALANPSANANNGLQAVDASQVEEVKSQIESLEKRYKLDKPWPVSFLAWLYDPNDTTRLDGNLQEVPKGIDVTIGDLHIVGSGVLTGELGNSSSLRTGKLPISTLISDRWLNTLLLMTVSLVLGVLIAVPLGIITAVRQDSRLEHAITFSLFAGISMPPFVLGLLLISLLALIPKLLHMRGVVPWLPYLPISGVTDFGQETNFLNRMYHLVLPALTLALIQGVWMSRHIRSAMLEVLRQDYIRTAMAKGLPERGVVVKHALRNALISLSTVLGLLLPGIVSGAMVIERVFNYTGMGILFFDAFGGCIDPTHETGCPGGRIPDYPLALILTMILVILVAFSNFLADILYTAADPRISFENR
ncbi:MAG: ABC transporter permease [Chloroflexia bacterium]